MNHDDLFFAPLTLAEEIEESEQDLLDYVYDINPLTHLWRLYHALEMDLGDIIEYIAHDGVARSIEILQNLYIEKYSR